jgi:uncharacterized protein (DUF2141 family)
MGRAVIGRAALALVPLLAVAAFPVPPKAERGRAGADCRPDEPGPAIRVEVEGLKDRSGALQLELYPVNNDDFLAADKVLIAAGKTFRRVLATPQPGLRAAMCVRAPRPGTYAVAVLHDRDGNGKFGVLKDGVGFANNPPLGMSKPNASAAAVTVPDGVVTIRVRMNYRSGFAFAPLERATRQP